MKKIFCVALLFAFLMVYLPVFAKTTVPADTDIVLVPTETVTSKDHKDIIRLNVKDDVIIDNQVIFQNGAKAIIKVVDSTPPAYVGIPGILEIFNGYVYDTKGNRHDVLIGKKYEANDRVWVKILFSLGFTIILCPFFLFGFIKGKDAKITPQDEVIVRLKDSFIF